MLIAITNRHLSNGNFFDTLREIAKAKVDKIILREKDLSKNDYLKLAKKSIAICSEHDVDLAIHTHVDIAKKLNSHSIHLPFDIFKENLSNLDEFESIGVSIHSVCEAIFASENGASYVLAGHIFKTNSKINLPERGLSFLKDLHGAISIDIYGVGGINQSNVCDVLNSGADGVAIMSDLWSSETPYDNVLKYKSLLNKQTNKLLKKMKNKK